MPAEPPRSPQRKHNNTKMLKHNNAPIKRKLFFIIEVRGDPHGVFRPREGGLTRIRCFHVVVLSLSSSSDLKNTKIQKQHFRLFSDSYERTRRAVRCKRIVRTRGVFFVKMPNSTKSTFYGPGLGPRGPTYF